MTSADSQKSAGWRVTWAGVAVNIVLVAVKLVAGLAGHSEALIADAVHSLSDFVTDAVVLIGLRAGRRAPDASHPYGHGRFETLASSIVALSLIGVAAFIAVDAIGRLVYGQFEQAPSWYTIGAAGLSIGAKEALYQVTMRAGRRARSAALIANAWHHRSDALSSIAVFVGVLGAQLHPSLRTMDGYAAIVVAILIVKVGLSILWDSLKEMTDTAPPKPIVEAIRECAGTVAGVRDVHGLKVRTVGGSYQIELDIVVDGWITVSAGHEIAVLTETAVRDAVAGVSNIIVHVDPEDDERA